MGIPWHLQSLVTGLSAKAKEARSMIKESFKTVCTDVSSCLKYNNKKPDWHHTVQLFGKLRDNDISGHHDGHGNHQISKESGMEGQAPFLTYQKRGPHHH